MEGAAGAPTVPSTVGPEAILASESDTCYQDSSGATVGLDVQLLKYAVLSTISVPAPPARKHGDGP